MIRHALIIGAGPAGSLAAILLARAGARVTLVEQSRFPRDKVCGECISALGIAVLTRAGLIDRLHELGSINFTQAQIHAPTGESCEIPLPLPMLGISRAALDLFLLTEARAAGATIIQPARCESLDSTPEGVTATIRKTIGGEEADSTPKESGVAIRTELITADIALLADGKGKLLPHVPPPTGDFGIKAHFTHITAPPNTIELFGVAGHYGGLSAVEGDRWNTSFAVPASRLRDSRGDLDQLFANIVSENITLQKRFKHARRSSEWHTAPLTRFGVIRDWPANVIPLGNAAAAIEPIGGEGMGLAMRSAEITVAQLLLGDRSQAALRRSFGALWSPRRIACRAAALIISSPYWSKKVLPLVTDDNPLLGPGLEWIGKQSGGPAV